MPSPAKAQPDPRTRRTILELLKRSGPQDANGLAEEIGVSAMAVRQHLYVLADEKLVTYEKSPRPRGRPAKLWRLTAEADRLFPDAHADLAVSLVESMRDAFGAEGLERLLAARTEQQIASYRGRIPRRASLKRKLDALAEVRSAEGYMAETIAVDDGSYLLVENHCSICAAATSCLGLCASELTVFRSVLGDGVDVDRTEHIVSGDRRCVYTVRRRPAGRSTP